MEIEVIVVPDCPHQQLAEEWLRQALDDAQMSTTDFTTRAVAGDELVALAAYSLLWPAAGVTSSLYLKELYVRERWRRQGLGCLMMAELRRVAQELGCSRLEWTTDAENGTAQAFYAALGSAVNSGKVMYRIALPGANGA